MAEQEKVLPWLKWHTKDVINYREVFNAEQMGELFFAVMKTVENGERQEVSTEIKFAYLQLCTYVEESRKAYFKKCEINAMNGSKGGKAKAAKAKAESETESAESETNEAEVKPPTLTKFRNIAKHICKEYDFRRDAYEIDSLFDLFAKNNWCLAGKSILEKSCILEAAIFAKLADSWRYVEIFIAATEKGKDIDTDMLEYIVDSYDSHQKIYIDPQNKKVSLTADEAIEAYFSDDEFDENQTQ